MNARRWAAALALAGVVLLAVAEFTTVFEVTVGSLGVVKRSSTGGEHHGYALLVIALAARGDGALVAGRGRAAGGAGAAWRWARRRSWWLWWSICPIRAGAGSCRSRWPTRTRGRGRGRGCGWRSRAACCCWWRAGLLARGRSSGAGRAAPGPAWRERRRRTASLRGVSWRGAAGGPGFGVVAGPAFRRRVEIFACPARGIRHTPARSANPPRHERRPWPRRRHPATDTPSKMPFLRHRRRRSRPICPRTTRTTSPEPPSNPSAAPATPATPATSPHRSPPSPPTPARSGTPAATPSSRR